MFLKRPRLATVAALLTLAGATDCFAQASASAAATGIEITLVDTDLTDGITPSLRFRNPSHPQIAEARTAETSDYQNGPFGTFLEAVVSTGGSASATIVAGDVFLPSSTYGLQSTASIGDPAALFAVADGHAGFINAVFDLTPHTSVVISATAAVDVAASTGWTASSAAFIQLSFGPILRQSSMYKVESPTAVSSGGTPELSVAWENATLNSVTGSLTLYETSYVLSPTPEPQTVVLAALGVVVLVLRCRHEGRSGASTMCAAGNGGAG